MLKYLDHLFEKIEETPLTLHAWALALTAIIGVRIAIELFFENITFRYGDHFFYQFLHHYLTFLSIYLTALPLVVWFAKVSIKKAALILLFGFMVIWTPPIVDEILSKGQGFWSFYSFDSLPGLAERYLTFFGDKPDVGITYGVRTEIGLVLILMTVYVFVRTRSWLRTLLGTLSLYTVLFIIGVFPSLVTVLLLGPEKGWLGVTELDVARIMLSPEPLYLLNPPAVSVVLAIKMGLVYALFIPPLVTLLLWTFFRPTLTALWNNLRLPQVIYHIGLFTLGVATVLLYEEKTGFVLNWMHGAGLILMVISVILAWTTSVIVNDLNDVPIDSITNTHRPLITNAISPDTYRTIGVIMFVFSLLYAGYISTQLAFLLALYQAIAWLYSAPPLRLKRFPGIATLLAASASMLVFFGGYIVFSLNKNISELPWSISALLFFAYCTLLPIKDFKDIPGDAKDGVTTLPILWGEVKAKRIIGSLAFFCFIVSVFIFDVRHLFPLAFFFGSLAYWLLQMSSATHRYFSYHRLAGWYITLVSSYVAFLAFHFFTR